jgi:alkylation response protein AidB-like acyl-CoA dehydrogenase
MFGQFWELPVIFLANTNKLNSMVTTATLSPNDEQLAMIRQSARDFAESRIRPNVMDWDEKEFFPKDLFKEMGE